MVVHDIGTMVVHGSGTMVVHDAGTMVVHDTGTMVVHGDRDRASLPFQQLLSNDDDVADGGAESYSATTVMHTGGRGIETTSDVPSFANGGAGASPRPFRAPDDGSSYWAAVQAAADNNSRGGGDGGQAGGRPADPHLSPFLFGGGGGGQGDAAKLMKRNDPLARTKDRLFSAYDDGSVIPVPFLSAAGAQPLALLDCLAATPRGGTSTAATSSIPPGLNMGLLPMASGELPYPSQ